MPRSRAHSIVAPDGRARAVVLSFLVFVVVALLIGLIVQRANSRASSTEPVDRVFPSFTAQEQPESPRTIFVSPDGSDGNSGQTSAPLRSVDFGLRQLHPGDTLVLRGGDYAEKIRNPTIRSGTAELPITVTAYPGESPVIRGSCSWPPRKDYWTSPAAGSCPNGTFQLQK